MPVSSLVFVVILAVWAVYLVQHWVRRRDHLATARSVDRFSEAMRVLERRRALPVPEVYAQRSNAASPLRPARPGRPEVVVKQQRRGAAHGATAVAPSAALRRYRRAARVRAAGLVVGSLTMVALVGLAMAGLLPRWTALAGVAACALTIGLVRWSVARHSAARRTRRTATPARRPRPRQVSATGRTAPVGQPTTARAAASPTASPRHHPAARPQRRTHDGHAFSAQSVAATLRTTSRREAERGPVQHEQAGPERSVPELYDIHAVEESLSGPAPTADQASTAPAAPREPADGTQPADGTWQPVPVPPPTYTLKARAYRPAPTVPASLPADGTEMALEEEFEDLPRIDRVS